MIESGHGYGRWHFVCNSLSSELPVLLLAPGAIQYSISHHTAVVRSALTLILMLPINHPSQIPCYGEHSQHFSDPFHIQMLFTSTPCASSLHQNSNPVLVLQPQSSHVEHSMLLSVRRICAAVGAAGRAAGAEMPGSCKSRWYLVINEVLKMRCKRLNSLFQLLGPYVYGITYLCFN